MYSDQFQSISINQLVFVNGGQQATPPPQVTKADAVEVVTKATTGTLDPLSLLGNIRQSVDQYNDPAIKDEGTGIKLLNGFCGLFGINPLKKK